MTKFICSFKCVPALRISSRVAMLGLLLIAAPLFGQQPSPTVPRTLTPEEVKEIQELKSEMKRIEARLDALESGAVSAPATASTATVASSAVPASTAAASTETAQEPGKGPEAVKEAADHNMDTMDAGMGGETIKVPIIPAIKIRGFGDVRAVLANQNLAVINPDNPGGATQPYQGGNSTFALGIMDLFVSSKISETFSYLAEIGFEAGTGDNGVGVDLERAQITWMPNDKLSISAGRTHAMLGYYNTAYHHGTWFQTSIDRPHIFQFEDSGGPLPIHNVGISAMGKLPSGKLGLHWLAELGNGKQTYSLNATVTPANVLADHTGKSTNVGLYARPEALPGLQVGFDWYRASLVPQINLMANYGNENFPYPNAVNYYKQNIFISHVVYIRPSFEFLAEGVAVRDLPRGSTKPLYTSGGYSQISKLFKDRYRPYVRYQWLNPNFNDPNNAWAGRWVGPSTGVRFDLNTFAALKFEYSHFDWKNFSVDSNGNQILPILHKTVDQVGAQLTYTF